MTLSPQRNGQDEIEKGLFSMEALVAIFTPGFDSNWTDQETGIAIGRDNVLIIPIMKGLAPYGFIGKFQGLQGEGKTVNQVADGIFQILTKNNGKQNHALQRSVGRPDPPNQRYIFSSKEIETAA